MSLLGTVRYGAAKSPQKVAELLKKIEFGERDNDVVYVFLNKEQRQTNGLGDVDPATALDNVVELDGKTYMDPSRAHPWNREMIEQVQEWAVEIAERVRSGGRAVVLCQAGMNRSRTLAALANKLLGHQIPDDDMPMTDELKTLVNAAGDEDSLETLKKTGVPPPVRSSLKRGHGTSASAGRLAEVLALGQALLRE
jgi:hypothetical protein